MGPEIIIGIVVGVLVIGGAPAIYQLTEGTEEENDPFIIRPNDYDSQTGNKRVWKQLM